MRPPWWRAGLDLSCRSASVGLGTIPDYFDREVGIEERVLVHSGPCISTRIAHHPRATDLVVEAVVRMAVDPQLGLLFAEEMFLPVKVKDGLRTMLA